MTSQTILLYLFKSTLISGIFVAYYWIALRDKKFHYYNRFYLLTASIISLIAPLLNFNWFSVEEPSLLYRSNELIQFILPTTTSDTGIHLDFADYILVFTGIITIVLLVLLLMHILKIQLLKNKYEVTKMDGFDFINTNEDNAPFSFLNNLFWKQSISLQEVSGQQIFKHEITHIQQKHTWDRIYCQLVASIFWMNPFNWLIQKELVAIHEFIADEEALGNSNVEAFAKMLLHTHYGNHFLNPTHSFFYSSIKRRLAMLTQTSNPKYSYLRRVMVLPILVITISLVSIKVHAREKIEQKVKDMKNDFTLLVGDTSKLSKMSSLKSLSTSPTPQKAESADSKAIVNPLTPQKAKLADLKAIVNIKLDTITSKKINLQNKIEDLTVIGYTNVDTGEVTSVFVAPKIQKNVDPQKNNDPIFYTTEKPAKSPNGWSTYLMNNLDRNMPYRNKAVPGKYTVRLNFVISKDGDVENVIAENDPGYGTAKEAIRVIENGPKWIPAEQAGKKVNSLVKQVIVFNVAGK